MQASIFAATGYVLHRNQNEPEDNRDTIFAPGQEIVN